MHSVHFLQMKKGQGFEGLKNENRASVSTTSSRGGRPALFSYLGMSSIIAESASSTWSKASESRSAISSHNAFINVCKSIAFITMSFERASCETTPREPGFRKRKHDIRGSQIQKIPSVRPPCSCERSSMYKYASNNKSHHCCFFPPLYLTP